MGNACLSCVNTPFSAGRRPAFFFQSPRVPLKSFSKVMRSCSNCASVWHLGGCNVFCTIAWSSAVCPFCSNYPCSGILGVFLALGLGCYPSLALGACWTFAAVDVSHWQDDLIHGGCVGFKC